MYVFGYLILGVHLVFYYKGSIAMENAANFVQITSCTCLGYVVTYECTVMRGLGTLWRGSAFDCRSSSNEIQLLESMYESPDSGNFLNVVTCNNGMIRGRVVRIDERFYTSQLHVTVSSDLIGKNLSCLQDNGVSREIIGSPTIIHNTGARYAPPQGPSLIFIDISLRNITFSWSPVAPDCPAIHYNILALNCGICPTTTNYTNVTCTDVPTNVIMCTFAVETVVCENITGNLSEHLEFNVTTFDEIKNSNKVDTISKSFFIVGVTALLITIVIVIFICYWLYNRSAATKTSSRFNETITASSDGDSSPSRPLQTHCATSQQENRDTYEYSQLMETPVNPKQLLKKLQGQISKQWYQLGLTLGLPMDVLEGFNLYSEDDCLAEVLDYWLKHHPDKPTWQEITDAQKKVEIFNTDKDTGMAADKKAATASDIPPPKPPRRSGSVIMKEPATTTTETATNDPGHEYEVIH